MANSGRFREFYPAQLTEGKDEWVVYFYAYDPRYKRLRRKRFKVNRIKNKKERRKHANELIRKINANLEAGWNPWIEQSDNKEYSKLLDVINKYIEQLEVKFRDDLVSKETKDDYVSYLKNWKEYLTERGENDLYVYEFTKNRIIVFLDYIYYEKKRTAQTRNNYLNFLRVFSGWLVEHDYLKSKPTDAIKPIRIRTGQKKRTVISQTHLRQIRDYLAKYDEYFLFAVEFIYYTFIRPREMSQLQIKHLNFTKGVIFIPAHISKNEKDDIVTIPNTLGRMMIDMKIYDYPEDYYIFARGCKPGEEYFSEKQFRDKWLKLRRKLNFPDAYKFYSLKDTGITDMLKHTNDTLAVRDQARHHSISMTNTYTDFNQRDGNDKIRNIDY